MKLIKYLKEAVKFRSEMVGSYSGQSDLRIIAYVNDEKAGYIDYSNYQGEISIKFIEVLQDFKKQGIGKQLMFQLQKEYPKTEINWGMLTGDGAKLYKSIKSKLYVDKGRIRKIDQLKKEYKKLKGLEQTAIKTDNWKNWDNDIYDRMYEIEQELYDLEK